jgi:hypothetical protein
MQNLVVRTAIAPIIWAVHFLLLWIIGEFGCSLEFVTPTAQQTAVLAVTGVAAAMTAVNLINLSRHRAITTDQTAVFAEQERQQFMVQLGIIFSGFFTAVMLIEAIPVFILAPCGG